MDDAALRSWIESKLLPSLSLTGRRFTVELPESGTASTVRRLHIEEAASLILRAHDHRLGGLRTAAALRHLESLGLPGPRLVLADCALTARLMPGAFAGLPCFTVETLIEGRRHAELADAAAAKAALKVASLLARFHRVTRPAWGWPDRERRISWAAETLRAASRMSGELAARGWLTESQRSGLGAVLASWRDPLEQLRPFHMVHNDANRHNAMVTGAGEVVLIDLHRLSYEPFPEEVVNALYHFCRKDDALAQEFLAAYLERIDEAARTTWDHTRGFFTALNYLKRLHRRAHQAQLQPPGLQSDDAKMARWRDIMIESAVAPRPGSRA